MQLSDRVILVTGATDGLGRYLVGELAAAGANVVAHGRNPAKLEDLRAELSRRSPRAVEEPVVADLAALGQVEQMARDLEHRLERLDVLVNNAGIGFGPRGGGRENSADGYELRFAVNYLAGYHLVRRLLPLLASSAPARVVNVSSVGQEPIDFDDLMLERAYDGVRAYRRSKLAQVMFTFDLATELDAATVAANTLHPATFMDTAMVREFGGRPVSTVQEGGAATLRLIADPELSGVSGRYFEGTQEARANPQAYDATARKRLREATDALIRKALEPVAS